MRSGEGDKRAKVFDVRGDGGEGRRARHGLMESHDAGRTAKAGDGGNDKRRLYSVKGAKPHSQMNPLVAHTNDSRMPDVARALGGR